MKKMISMSNYLDALLRDFSKKNDVSMSQVVEVATMTYIKDANKYEKPQKAKDEVAKGQISIYNK